MTEGALNDSILVRSGIRVLGVDPATSRITINGQIVNLHGFNRHTMWPDSGGEWRRAVGARPASSLLSTAAPHPPSIAAAVTPAQEAADLALLQGVNANYVRGAHYPQSQSWLDLLDEAGIVLWEETLGPGTS